MKFAIEAQVEDYIEDTINAETRKEAVKKFNREHGTGFPLMHITSINGKEVIGLCETCSIPILAGESVGPYSDVNICSVCEKED